MRTERSDEELLTGCRRGEDSAWAALVNRYQRLIYAVPRRAGLDQDLCAEVFQEVFATLVEKLDDIEQPERLQAWLVTTARRKTWRLIKTQGRSPSYYDEEGDDKEWERLRDDAPLPDEVLIELEKQHEVRMAVEALDERCRQLLTLLFYEAEPPPYSEIAARTGVAEGGIGPTRARCLQKLLRLLEK